MVVDHYVTLLKLCLFNCRETVVLVNGVHTFHTIPIVEFDVDCVRRRYKVFTSYFVDMYQPPVSGEGVPDDDREKFEREFNEYRQKLDQAKEECVHADLCCHPKYTFCSP